VNTGEPDLADALVLGATLARCHVRRDDGFPAFVPKHGMKRGALVVERQCMARPLHFRVELTIG